MQGLPLLNGHGTPRGILAVDRLTKFSKGLHPVVAEVRVEASLMGRVRHPESSAVAFSGAPATMR